MYHVGPVEIDFSSPSGVTLVPQILNNNDGLFKVELNEIKNIGEIFAHVKFSGSPIPKSPFPIQVIDQGTPVEPSKVKLYGPAIDGSQIPVNVPTHFVVDCKDSGPGKIFQCVEAVIYTFEL